MKSFFNYKFITLRFREYIFIFLTATIFSLIFISKSPAEENVFVIEDIQVNGSIDLNFTRDKYINKAFLKSFDLLMSKIILSKDLLKFKDLKLNEIKKLTKNFQILSENYKKDEYEAKYRIVYDHNKIKNLLVKKNVAYSQPKNISVITFPTPLTGPSSINSSILLASPPVASYKLEKEIKKFLLINSFLFTSTN